MGVLLYIFSIVIFYLVVKMAVRDGINSSKIGQSIEEKDEIKQSLKASFLDNDLDN
ncbi:hypothetical protein [Thalassobacillus devorans]|uniref:hypothetical protein n=1 Tax=Thalassobacillus devorans TaxID=279813 RepID=UPI0004B647AD|nr:hypothetical protein [Thalassobacillus devorans]